MGTCRIIILSALAALSLGCTNKLETGYEPARLGTLTPAQRRGLYAQDFTMESRAAEADQENQNKNNGADIGSHMPGGNP